MSKKLTKSREKKFCGVCGGIANYIDIDPTVIRIGYAIITVLNMLILGVIVYGLLSVIMPENIEEGKHI